MPTYLQSDRFLKVTTPLGPDALLLVGLSGHEAISDLFRFNLDVLAENDASVPFEKLLGQKISVELQRAEGDVRYIHGICSRIAQGRRDATFTGYHLEMVPQFWFMTRIAQSRIFQQLTVPEILAKVFQGFDVELKLTGDYPARDYCVQYRETDFNFASRLMEEEGIFYFFRHTSRGHTLVVTDTPQSFGEAAAPLIYQEAEGDDSDKERIRTWEKVQELRSGKYTLWDHCFELPHKHLDAEKAIQESVAVGTVSHKLNVDSSSKLEVYDYPGEYAQRFDGVNPGGGDRQADLMHIFEDNKRTVEIRMQEEAAAGLALRGSSDIWGLLAGLKFSFKGHFNADGPYVVTGVQHTASLGDYRSELSGEVDYRNTFTCIPRELPYRPRRITPKPVVHGTQTAVVVGPSGEEIFTDKYSRVKVQFHWDRQGKNDGGSSCWVRVGTPWAGKHWGMIHIPRIGQEVIVAFEEGDPDRPIIVGSVYNADMMPPYDLPQNKTQSGIKSRSTLGGTPDNFNELRFEDKKGSEQVYFHAEKNFDRVVENNDTLKVGFEKKGSGDQTLEIFNNQSLKVGCPQASDGSQTISVYKDRTETVETGNESVTVKKGNRSVSVDMGNDDHRIKMGNRGVVIDMGNDALTIKMGNQTTKLNLGKSSTEAMQSIELKVGQSSLVIDQMGVKIKGMMISVEGQISTQVKGLMTQVTADAMLKMGGAITMIG